MLDLSIKVKELADKRTQLEEEGKAIITSAFKEMFAAFPDLEFVTWTQYSPYFNDGEPSHFGRHEMTFCTKAEKEAHDAGDLDDYELPDSYSEDYPEITSALKQLEEIDDDYYELLFGDHAKITVTREGINVEEYSHD